MGDVVKFPAGGGNNDKFKGWGTDEKEQFKQAILNEIKGQENKITSEKGGRIVDELPSGAQKIIELPNSVVYRLPKTKDYPLGELVYYQGEAKIHEFKPKQDE